jgi:hypothetical protein
MYMDNSCMCFPTKVFILYGEPLWLSGKVVELEINKIKKIPGSLPNPGNFIKNVCFFNIVHFSQFPNKQCVLLHALFCFIGCTIFYSMGPWPESCPPRSRRRWSSGSGQTLETVASSHGHAQRPILNFTPGTNSSPRGEFCPLGGGKLSLGGENLCSPLHSSKQ